MKENKRLNKHEFKEYLRSLSTDGLEWKLENYQGRLKFGIGIMGIGAAAILGALGASYAGAREESQKIMEVSALAGGSIFIVLGEVYASTYFQGAKDIISELKDRGLSVTGRFLSKKVSNENNPPLNFSK